MENISDVKVGPMPADSTFVKPLRMTLLQNGRKRYWDFVQQHESVSCILFNKDRGVVVCVKQFRPAVYYGTSVPASGDNSVPEVDWTKMPAKNGITIELCAGIVDDSRISLAQTAQKEVLEECGYDVPLENFEKVISYRVGVGVSGDRANMFYAEITDAMKVSQGGGNIHEGELIDVVEMTVEEVRSYINQDDVVSPGGFLFGMIWFLTNKAPKC